MPRVRTKLPKPRHQPLLADIHDDSNQDWRPRRPAKDKQPSELDDEELASRSLVLDAISSQKLLQLARWQQEELETGESDAEDDNFHSASVASARWREDSDSEVDFQESVDTPPEEISISEGDMAILETMYPTSSDNRRTLADVILSKLESSDLPKSSPQSGPEAGVDPRVVELFEKAGTSMRGTGGIPKVIKMLPSFPQWKRYLALANPSQWSPFAFRKVTNIFISSMKAVQVVFFLRYVLLPAVRENIEENGKLNVHYYEALLRALYKPAAFFKGVLFPLLDEGCTLKEAVIVSSVVAKKSIPSVHLGAAILHIASQDFTGRSPRPYIDAHPLNVMSGPRALILRVLLDKKKDLPYKVLDELVFNFVRVSNWAKTSKQPLPVLWHQSLLVLAQRYSQHLTSDQKDALLDIVRANYHHQIGPEIRRELAATPVRGQTMGEDFNMS
ncbi:snoRNA-binding rRNA-processing protein [Paramarasmius palmivorus]|uniref:SnoRNA-binding rRNA-processing protein n=1 Tax=Paramarasmius palmivorus TaxID=297713 RepID=A0AAW0EDX2_9AGAR